MPEVTLNNDTNSGSVSELNPVKSVPHQTEGAPEEVSEPGSGLDEVLLTQSPLDVNSIFVGATLPSTGATSLFVGTTRDNFEGKKVLKLEYEAYEPMALKELKRLCSEIREKWEVAKIIIHHRLGEVAITQPSVIIAISSPHRKESLEALNFSIERLKEIVPIWKKEKYEGGGEVWKENHECCWKDKVRKRRRVEIDESQIQVVVSKEEIDRRITAFIARKQEEKNKINCLEFCNRRPDEESEGCARTISTLVRREGSKSHLRTSAVNTGLGPKQHPKRLKLDKSPGTSDPLKNCPGISEPLQNFPGISEPLQNSPGISEPLQNRFQEIEIKLGEDIKPVNRDVYARLKLLEDRILLLESLSPEYSLISPETFKPNSLISSRSNPEKSEFWSHNRPNSETGEGRNRSKLSQLSAVISFSGQIKQDVVKAERRKRVVSSLSNIDQKIFEIRRNLKLKYEK